MKSFNDIEELYAQQSKQQQEIPPPEVWERINTSLNSQQTKKRIVWFRWAGVAALLAVAISVSVSLWNSHLPKQNSIDTKTAQNSSSNNPVQQPAQNSLSKKITTGKNIHNIPTVKNLTARSIPAQPVAHRGQMPQNTINIKASGENINLIHLNKNLFVPELFASSKIEIKKLKHEHSDLVLADIYRVDAIFGAEKRDETKKQRPKFEIGGSLTPIYSNGTKSSEAETLLSGMASENYSNPSEKGIIYAGGGLNISMRAGKKWALESGIRYARMGNRFNPSVHIEHANFENPDNNDVIKQLSLNNSMGTIRLNAAEQQNEIINRPPGSKGETAAGTNQNLSLFEAENITNRIEQAADYIEVPVTFRYYLVDKKLSLSLSAGASANILAANNVYLKNENSRKNIGKTEDIAKLAMSTHAGISLSVPVARRLSLQVEPRINYFIANFNSNSQTGFRPYSFGIYSGVQYRFGKQ